eukprot:CAMPEP_0118646542 /NCGR_PEP_ID=MMETSP0785-20121206/8117_1 /TAXON_ID=91992 /ORGANISM="Bolidomonas pacifica, Strain CCMP 1866" /LENGTH=228 /DNA_ID=CAMNT_0006538553 /DNA_START=117 /DNA_END=800 /DNA_ORIENTATION=-
MIRQYLRPLPSSVSALKSTPTPSQSTVVDPSSFPPSTVYTIKSPSPLGCILTEFDCPLPADGQAALTPLEVSDVSEGLNAGRLGVRTGDIVISLNGLPLVTTGVGYDIIVKAITTEFQNGNEVEIGLFRASENGGQEGFNGLVQAIVGGEDTSSLQVEGDDETPLNVSDLGLDEEEPVSVAELFKGLFKETKEAIGEGMKPVEKSKEDKKGGGLFGMFSQESIQETEN